jgi:hypothetical protein
MAQTSEDRHHKGVEEKGYRSDSRSYLARALGFLKKGRAEDLFYAAFELRCGIEARLQEYLEVQGHLSKKQKQGWRIADLGNKASRAFSTGDGLPKSRCSRTAALECSPSSTTRLWQNR